jgi:hypothetical protein
MRGYVGSDLYAGSVSVLVGEAALASILSNQGRIVMTKERLIVRLGSEIYSNLADIDTLHTRSLRWRYDNQEMLTDGCVELMEQYIREMFIFPEVYTETITFVATRKVDAYGWILTDKDGSGLK